MISPGDLRQSPNPLAADYSAFAVSDRILLTGHSHQAWPDVAREGQLEAFEDAARHVDDKWERASAKADEVRHGFRGFLHDGTAEIALGASTHELVTRLLSALDLRARPRLVTSDGEFHTLRRQLGRLEEAGLEVVREPTEPVATLAARMADRLDGRTAAALVSAVLFETSLVVPGLGALADAAAAAGAELVVDAYHALGPVPFDVAAMGLGGAWVVGGGYKYLQLGEGNAFLRLPPQAEAMRPVVTGWFAEFDALTAQPDASAVAYGRGAARFAGSTYDPTSNYRAARVFRFFRDRGLTPELLAASYRHQVAELVRRFAALDLPAAAISRDRAVAPEGIGGFLALRCNDPGRVSAELARRGVFTDTRGSFLRLGPAPYLSDAQLAEAIAALGAVALGQVE